MRIGILSSDTHSTRNARFSFSKKSRDSDYKKPDNYNFIVVKFVTQVIGLNGIKVHRSG
jgi:hypothetical protein